MKTHGEIGMALAMILPYLRYLQMHITDLQLLPKALHRFLPKEIHGWIRIGFGFAIFLTGLAILGTQSRGAMLAGVMVVFFLLIKSRQKFRVMFVIALLLPLMLTFMPQKWWDRMETITADQQSMDRSSYKRTVSWGMAMNMASHELTGGGYNCFREHEFDMYSSDTSAVADAHSVFFEVIGEHGWPGFVIFMLLAMTTWFRASRVARQAKHHKSLNWLSDLARMSQVSMAAYATSGLFIGQAYFDLYYAIIAVVTLSEVILVRELKRLEALDGKLSTPAGSGGGRPASSGPASLRPPNPSWKAYGGPQLRPPHRPR
jgi:probable O-glycosylation ligase (exosortase A-associated)